uniref:Uncharacterized protein n=1 Tax=candidate division WWE3 bacterium TaxID=2053526 RepID=A0A7C4TK65_UNCKA
MPTVSATPGNAPEKEFVIELMNDLEGQQDREKKIIYALVEGISPSEDNPFSVRAEDISLNGPQIEKATEVVRKIKDGAIGDAEIGKILPLAENERQTINLHRAQEDLLTIQKKLNLIESGELDIKRVEMDPLELRNVHFYLFAL